MKKILLFLTLFTGMTLTGCNDSFLEKYPVTSLTEENAFQSYDNFKAFMWPCYEMFSNTNIATSTTAIGRNSHYLGDVYAGYLEQRGASSQNKYAFQTVTNATSGNGWNFSSFIRRINIMLSHVDDSNMTEEEIAKAKAAVTDNGDGKSGELMVKMALIEPNREQPRKDFNEEQLAELADSIKRYGILQPLLVQKKGTFYEIIAGERRWRAAKIAGLKEIPVVLREYNKQESMEIALIENVQRSDLNPIEEALAYQRLVTEFKLTQEEIAARVSKNRATITNSMRLLKLDGQIQEMLIQNLISSGHARALLSLEDKGLQLKAAKMILDESLSVRETERLVKRLAKEAENGEEKKDKNKDEALALIYQSLEERMKSVMGTKVSIHNKDKNKGRIEIEYYSEAELERIVEMIESIR